MAYIDCGSNFKKYLCINGGYMCSLFLDNVVKYNCNGDKPQCMVYDFLKTGFVNYSYGKVKVVGEEEARSIKII